MYLHVLHSWLKSRSVGHGALWKPIDSKTSWRAPECIGQIAHLLSLPSVNVQYNVNGLQLFCMLLFALPDDS